MRNGKVGVHDFWQRMERYCPYRKEFDKTSRSKFISGCDSMRIENVHSHETSNADRTSHSALNSKRPPVGHLMNALIIIEKHNINLMKKTVHNCIFL